MSSWNPDLEFITRIEAFYTDQGMLDELGDVQEGTTVGNLIEAIVSNGGASLETADYLRKFPVDQLVTPQPVSYRKLIEEMKEGTPYGVLMYHILENSDKATARIE